MKRVQSPSSINTYFQCPRKYFYIYNLKLPTTPSIHLVRGSVVHLVLENFFDILPEIYSEDFTKDFTVTIIELLRRFWKENKESLDKLNLLPNEIDSYYKETEIMLINWAMKFSNKIKKQISNGLTFKEAFEKLKPIREKEYKSSELMIRGFIDAIENHDGIRLMDYKTSKHPVISEDYKLQLGIYALLYQLEHGVKPDKVGIYFLKHDEQLLDVTDDLIQNAKFKIEQIHMSTDGCDEIHQYPKKESPLCRWANGQCDFYSYCFEGKKVPDKKDK
jgi:putative RecB family exonuclease